MAPWLSAGTARAGRSSRPPTRWACPRCRGCRPRRAQRAPLSGRSMSGGSQCRPAVRGADPSLGCLTPRARAHHAARSFKSLQRRSEGGSVSNLDQPRAHQRRDRVHHRPALDACWGRRRGRTPRSIAPSSSASASAGAGSSPRARTVKAGPSGCASRTARSSRTATSAEGLRGMHQPDGLADGDRRLVARGERKRASPHRPRPAHRRGLRSRAARPQPSEGHPVRRAWGRAPRSRQRLGRVGHGGHATGSRRGVTFRPPSPSHRSDPDRVGHHGRAGVR